MERSETRQVEKFDEAEKCESIFKAELRILTTRINSMNKSNRKHSKVEIGETDIVQSLNFDISGDWNYRVSFQYYSVTNV